MNLKLRCLLLAFSSLIITFLFAPDNTNAQRRDYLTEAEIELVRDAQEIDLRIAVLTKAVDRRFAVIENKPLKEKSIWGDLPKGTRAELFLDIERLLQKAIDDIDNVADRSRDVKIFPKAVKKLADACTAYLPRFKTFLDSTKDEKERGALIGATTDCENVLEAAKNLPREESKPK